jgi:hypothetical protein
MIRHYAISWTYGIATTDDRRRPGHWQRCGRYYSFATRGERDRWVASGSQYRSERDYREAIPSSDPELRRLLTADARQIERGHFATHVEPAMEES